jgi:hypothetical protein
MAAAPIVTFTDVPLPGTEYAFTMDGNGLKSPVENGWWILVDDNAFTATLHSPVMLTGLSMLVDTRPLSAGSGVCVNVNSVELFCSPYLQIFVSWVNIFDDAGFDEVQFYSVNMPWGENLFITDVRSTVRPAEQEEPGQVPEPSSAILLGSALFTGVVYGIIRRKLALQPQTVKRS